MHPPTLCRESLDRILSILDRDIHGISVRDFRRTYGIEEWEVEQAENLGWIKVYVHKPPRGRPSTRVEKVSKTHHAKLLPYRHKSPRQISIRHQNFALASVTPVTGFSVPSNTEAYMMAFPRCRNRRAAAVGACRLMKRTDVKLMRRWWFCHANREVTGDMPTTVPALIQQLEAIGRIRFVMR